MDNAIITAKEVAHEVYEEDLEVGQDTHQPHKPKYNMQFGETGSEPYLRDDEAICPVTNLTYFKAMGRSPYVDENGRLV